jgi:hypothetical protein
MYVVALLVPNPRLTSQMRTGFASVPVLSNERLV